jgi:hypothetical protein
MALFGCPLAILVIGRERAGADHSQTVEVLTANASGTQGAS